MGLKVAIVPAGQWGTALAVPLSRGGHSVRLYFRAAEDADYFNLHRDNRRRLPGIRLPANVSATGDLAEAAAGADMIILAPSSAGLRHMCRQLMPLISAKTVIVSVVKALFPEEPRLVSEVIMRELAAPGGDLTRDGTSRAGDDRGYHADDHGDDGADGRAQRPEHAGAQDGAMARANNDLARRIAVVSGPNFAVEVARELPAGTVAASESMDTARFVQAALMTDRFRVWTSTDVVGVQLGGALKNIIAIGAGVSDGLGMGHNARAALITRGVAEIARLGTALGADPMTFAGVSGIGDLMLTCTGDLSRNRQAGLALARGEAIDPNTTVEGVSTTEAAYRLARELGIDMPITEVVYQILFEGLPPAEGLHRLMTRQPTSERDRPGP